MTIRVSVDFGGVITRHPDMWRQIITALQRRPDDIQVYVMTDIPDRRAVKDMLDRNAFNFGLADIIGCECESPHDEGCKVRLREKFQIDLHIDDVPAYCAPSHGIALLMMPDLSTPYFHDSFVTDGKEGAWGHRKA